MEEESNRDIETEGKSEERKKEIKRGQERNKIERRGKEREGGVELYDE